MQSSVLSRNLLAGCSPYAVALAGLTIKPVSIASLLESAALIAEYSAECSISEIGDIAPQADLYERLEKNGALRCFGAFDGDKLIGFGNVLVYVLPHYGELIATVESLFIAKAYRNSSAGSLLMRTMEAHSKQANCVGILYSCPVGGQLERLLEVSKPYARTNAVFYRRLD
jgi:GNAT superfamily N-acetyltransferase